MSVAYHPLRAEACYQAAWPRVGLCVLFRVTWRRNRLNEKLK
jgi:hypothetical protein